MIVAILIINIICGIWNSVGSFGVGSGRYALMAAVNWAAVGMLTTKLING